MKSFSLRRDWLNQSLDANSVVIVVGNTAKTRSKNINYHFRADNDLYYLTGFTEPNAVAVFRPQHTEPYVLFVRPNNAVLETSFGARAGIEGAKQQFAADNAFSIEDIDNNIIELFENRENVYLLDEQEIYSDRINTWLNHQRRHTAFDEVKHFRKLLPLQPVLHQKRIIKSAEEIAVIKKAVKASTAAHIAVMKACQPQINERQLEAVFLREIADHGCRDVAYPSIVAGGNNACCLHYENNDCQLGDGEMLLIDAGAEYQMYCSDITRSYPINGKFSECQAALYKVVLNAIDAAIEQVKPGQSWSAIHQTCMEKLTIGLIELGILTETFEQAMENQSYKAFSVHKTGHWLGMDVHDVGRYHVEGDWITLEANMVFTIEPGLYFPNDCKAVDKKWRGIGIRIEDDILVTETGCENLSVGVPRTISEIERIMSS